MTEQETIPGGEWKQFVRRGALGIVLYHLAFAAWVLLKPGNSHIYTIGDDLFQTVGGLLAAALCFAGWGRRGVSSPSASRRARWVPRLFGVSLLCYGLGQTAWSLNDLVLHRSNSGFGPADFWYLLSYPFLLAGILMLPTQPLPASARSRILLDALMNMVAIVTFSWYYLLGPTLVNKHLALSAKLIAIAYPTLDLVLVFCVLLLGRHAMSRLMRGVALTVSVGLAVTVGTDTITCYQALHGLPLGGGLIDLGWSLGYMPIGLAIGVLRVFQDSAQAGAKDALRPVGLWQSLLPYAFLPSVGALILALSRCRPSPNLALGVYVGAGVLVALVLLRQIMAIFENRALYAQLSAAQRDLHDNLRALTVANERLESLATTDAVSGLLNHRGMVAALDDGLEAARRRDLPCAVLFLDLDRFKALNDGFGHPAGDTVLQNVGRILRERLRKSDVLSRWGGEEFVLLLPETGLAEALTVAESARAGIAEHVFPVAGGIHVTCSIGVAVFPDHAPDQITVVNAADQAMYSAKRQGRNQVCAAGEACAAPAATARFHDAGASEQSDQYRLLFENAAHGIYHTTPDGRILLANPALLAMLGYDSFEELASRDLETQGTEAGYERSEFKARLEAEGEVRGLEAVWQRRNGTTIFVRENARQVWNPDGKTFFYVGSVEDITARKQAEEALQRSEARFQRNAANAPGMMYQFVLHPDGTFEFPFVSEGCRDIYGLEPSEIIADPLAIIRIVHPDDQMGFQTSIALSAQTLRPWKWEGRFLHASGETRWVQGASRPERQPNGDIVWDGLLMDVTERKTIQEALQRSHEELEDRVRERTADLASANAALQKENQERRQAEVALRESKQQIITLNRELTQAYDATIEGWSRALDLRDKETEGHCRRVTDMTLRLARALDLPASDLVHLRRGALLHDIGKMGVPDGILLKPGPLTEDEWTLMRRHPTYAQEMLSPIAFLRPALDIPHFHHEKWDGTGYPHQLAGEAIPFAARIFAVVDVWDALCSDRPYRAGWPPERVCDHIRSLAGTHFDPRVADAFLSLLTSDAPAADLPLRLAA